MLHNLYSSPQLSKPVRQCLLESLYYYQLSSEFNTFTNICGVIYMGANQVRTQRISTQFYANVNVKPFVKIVRRMSKRAFDIFLIISTIATAASTHTQLVFFDLICHCSSSKSIPKSSNGLYNSGTKQRSPIDSVILLFLLT